MIQCAIISIVYTTIHCSSLIRAICTRSVSYQMVSNLYPKKPNGQQRLSSASASQKKKKKKK